MINADELMMDVPGRATSRTNDDTGLSREPSSFLNDL